MVFNLLVYFNYSVWVALPLYTEQRFDVSAEANANLLLVITIMHLIAAFPAGRAIRVWGGRPVLVGGIAGEPGGEPWTVGRLAALPVPNHATEA